MSRSRYVVLVPGAWYGAWTFDPVAERLRGRGHDVVALTLTGLEPDACGAALAANLEDHVEQVAAVVAAAPVPVTLAGHSYGGLVIAAVADRHPDAVEHLVHVDACVPADGDSFWSMGGPSYRRLIIAGASERGHSVRPPIGADPRARPHPVASMLQEVRLTGAGGSVPRRTAVFAARWRASPFAEQHARLSADPGWETHELPVGHDVMAEAPDDLARILDPD